MTPEPPPIGVRTPEERQVVTMVRWLLYATFVVVGYLVVSFAASVLAPVLAAFFIAYLMTPVLAWLERRGFSRNAGALMLLAAFVGATVTAITLVAPRMADEAQSFVSNLPRLIGNLSQWFSKHLHIDIPADWKSFLQGDHLKHLVGDVGSPLPSLASAALGGALGVLGTVAELLLVPVFSFYFLVDFPRIRKNLVHVIPPRNRAQVLEILRDIDTVVAGWVRGQAIVTTILAILYAIGFSVIGLPLAIPIGLLVGTLTIVPVIGAVVGAIITVLITLADGGSASALLGIGIVFACLHLLENAVLTPKITGHKVGLSESGALFAVFAGGKLLGFVGVLLAVPIAAAVAVLVRHAVRYYEHTRFFGQEKDAVVEITPAMATIMIAPIAPTEDPHAGTPLADEPHEHKEYTE